MELTLTLAGIGAGIALTLTRKSGPFKIFDRLSGSGSVLFYCSLCSSFWAILLARVVFSIWRGEWTSTNPVDALLRILYDSGGGFGWSLFVLGVTGNLDLDFVGGRKGNR